MEHLTRQSQISVLGSSRSVTDSASGVDNAPPSYWMPGLYDGRIVTSPGQSHATEEQDWAALAASSRADWAADNPF